MRFRGGQNAGPASPAARRRRPASRAAMDAGLQTHLVYAYGTLAIRNLLYTPSIHCLSIGKRDSLNVSQTRLPLPAFQPSAVAKRRRRVLPLGHT